MKRIADTSFLCAAFDQEDALHRAALDEIAKPQALGVPLVVLAEFLDLVEYRHDRKTAIILHDNLQKLGTLTIAPIEDEPRVLSLWTTHPGISLADAAGIAACLETDAALLSYDVKQGKVLAKLRAKR